MNFDALDPAIPPQFCFVCATPATFKSGPSYFCPHHITEDMKIRALLARVVELLEAEHDARVGLA